MKTSRTYAALAALAVAALSAAQWSGLPIYTTTLNGDFIAEGAFNCRTAVTGGGPTMLTTTTPGGSTYVKTFAVWNWLSDSAGFNAAEAAITVNAVGVTGVLGGVGADLCWGKTGGKSYIADVSHLVAADGVHTITGVADKVVTGGSTSLGEGVSLLSVYSNGASALNTVDVYHGYAGAPGGPVPSPMTFSAAYAGGPAHLFLNALDGQPAADDWFINGVLASGVFPGTAGAGDAWVGLKGLYYDHADGDASGYMTIGDTGILLDTAGTSDCIGHSFGAMAYSAVPEPATMIALGLGAAALIRRRKK